ncbi:FkbM family methyltransferase [Brevibacillus centrosporus]|uniref:FkbM family methyltransferase n=1 Tax=Brevibacillus centrosporus TaxID=54910 RepID=UPI003985C73F
MDTLSFYEKQVYSQNGEDGMIEELFSRIGTTNQIFVEFGVSVGLECLTHNLLVHHGWSGLMIEADPQHFQQLEVNFGHILRVTLHHERVSRENIASIFRANHIPASFDFLSIDIDGNDYWVWQALSEWKPRVVVIEYNASFPPPQKMVVVYDPNFSWDGTTHFGASLTSLAGLGKQLGYALIGTDTRGVNAFFIRRDLLAASGFEEQPPEQAYHPPSYGPVEGGHPRRIGPHLEI